MPLKNATKEWKKMAAKEDWKRSGIKRSEQTSKVT